MHGVWKKCKDTILFPRYVLIVVFVIFLTWFVTSISKWFIGEHAPIGRRVETTSRCATIQSSLTYLFQHIIKGQGSALTKKPKTYVEQNLALKKSSIIV